MRVLLINPSQKAVYGSFASPDYPPVGLGYLAAALEQHGHSVRILDVDAEKATTTHVVHLIQRDKPRLVGITTTTPTFKSAQRLAELIKTRSDTKIVVGGIHATIDPEAALKPEAIDYAVQGEGELTIVELASAIERGTRDLSTIDGLCHKVNKTVHKNKPRQLIANLDDLPFPARHLFKSQSYTYPDAMQSPTIPIITSRGCPGQCTYCCTKQIFTMRFRARSAQNVVDEIESLIKTAGAREIHIWDDNATLIKRRVFEIRDELARRNIKMRFAFPNGTRVDAFDDEIALALRQMGAYSVAFGVESGNQHVLNNIRKGVTLDQIRKAFKIAKRHGFETWGFFMIGLPGDSVETVDETIRFAVELDPDVAKFHILKPFPGTEVYHQLRSQGLITEQDPSLYGIHTKPVHYLPNLSAVQMLAGQKKAYRTFYLRPRIMARQLLRMRSYTRFKLNMQAGLSLLRSFATP